MFEAAHRGGRGSTFEWAWYDQPDPEPGLTLEDVCTEPLVAVLAEGGPVMVTRHARFLDETRAIAARHGLSAITSADLFKVASAI